MPSYVRPGTVSPLLDRTSEHDSPHGGDMDSRYRAMTDALVWRCSMASRSWTWPYYPALGETSYAAPAPSARISTADTWVEFGFSGAEVVRLPWRFTEGAEKILIYTGLLCPFSERLQVRWDSETLVDAVATATGEVAGGTRPNNQPESLSWELRSGVGESQWALGTWYSWLTPTVPANRRVVLEPHVKVTDNWAGFASGGVYHVYLVSACVMDIPPRETGGW